MLQQEFKVKLKTVNHTSNLDMKIRQLIKMYHRNLSIQQLDNQQMKQQFLQKLLKEKKLEHIQSIQLQE